MIEPWHWLIFGFVLMIAEMFVPTFFLLWFGAAAILVAAVLWAVSLSFVACVLLWTALSVVFCILWLKFIQPKIKNRTKAGLGASVIIGEVGRLTIVPRQGKAGSVRFNIPKAGASEWFCRTKNESLQVGDKVVVVDVVGNELLVESI